VSRSGGKRLTLAEFAERLDRRLKGLSAVRLRSILRSHGEGLPADERASFLAIFEASPRRSGGDEDLLADVARVVAEPPQAEDQEFDFPERGYDPWDDEGPEVYWPELDALFGRAEDAFQEGRLALACSAYKELFGAILERYEDGSIDLQLDSDLDEAKARYLRALYETLPPRERPAALLQAMRDLVSVGGRVGLAEVVGVRRAPLPDRNGFLARWRDRLLSEVRGRRRAGEPGTDAGALLLEAVALRDGAAGLGAFARQHGRLLPQAWREWVQALAAARKPEAALSAAHEAVRVLESGPVRAWACEFVADAARRRKDGEAVLGARREALRSAPTIVRLSALCSATMPGELSKVAAEDVVLVRERWAKGKRGAGSDVFAQGAVKEGRRLLALLYLLAGDPAAAVALVPKGEPRGWSDGEHPGAVVVPWLLVAGCAVEPPADTSLAACWAEVDHCASPYAAYESFDPADDLDAPPSDEEAEDAPKPLCLTPALRAGMDALDKATRARLLEKGAALARARVETIVSNKNRGAYERAARLWSAVHDAHVLAGRADEGARLLAGLRDSLSRHYRFRERLDAAVRGSSAALDRWRSAHPQSG
jgi:hypothetical protein